LAILPINADQVISALGITLVAGVEEGLGSWLATAIHLSCGAVVEIIDYAERPEPKGFILRVDIADSFGPVLDEVIGLFGLNRASLPWISPILD